MFGRFGIAILLLATGGCHTSGKPGNLVDVEPFICGPWSEPKAEVRCRLRVESTHVAETGTVIAALELVNSGNQTVAVVPPRERESHGAEPALIWTVGTKIYLQQSTLEIPRELKPHQACVIGPAELQLAPTPGARAGKRALSASLDTGALRLLAVPVNVSVTPANWGPTTGPIRVCLAAPRDTMALDKPANLFLYVHNAAMTPWEVIAPDWAAPFIRSEDGLITLRYLPRADGRIITHPGGLIQRHELDISSVFSRAGTYRVRVQLVGIGAAVTSTQPIDSNEILLRVVGNGPASR